MNRNSGSKHLICDAKKMVRLRHSLGWTQVDAGEKSGYTSRLIRKLEAGGSVRPSTLLDVLQCYHEALGELGWCMSDFIAPLKNGLDGTALPVQASDATGVEVVKNYFETVFNQRDLQRIPEFVASNVKFSHGEGEPQFGIQVIHQLAQNILNGFDPIRHAVRHAFVEEGQVFCFWSVEMKHVGVFSGVEATEKWVKTRGQTVCRLENGLMVEAHDSWDVYDVIRQLNGQPKQWF